MTNKVQHKRSAILDKRPLTTDLDLGEIAVNTFDGRLYVKKDNGSESIVRIGEELSIDVNRTGFLNQTETTMSFDDTTRTFTLSPVGTTWSYYRQGKKYTITGSKSIVIPATDEKQNFIWIDSTDGTLTTSISPWDVLNGSMLLTALVYWDSTQTPKYFLQEERHSCLIDRRQHAHDHFTIGTRFRTAGALSGYTLNTDTNAAKTFSIADTVILDEDIAISIPLLAEPNGTNTDYLICYRTAPTTWKWKDSAMPFSVSGSNWIQWDNNGTLTDATGGNGGSVRWLNSYVCFTNINGKARHMIIPGRGIYTSLAAAQAEDPSTFDYSVFPTAEFILGYQLTWTTSSSNSAGQCRLAVEPKKIAVGAISTAISAPSVDHNSLSGLLGGTANEYYHLTSDQHGYIQNPANVNIDGGTIDGTTIGATNRANGYFGQMFVTSPSYFQSNTQAVSGVNQGALGVSGGATVAKDLVVHGNVFVDGSSTLTGPTTIANIQASSGKVYATDIGVGIGGIVDGTTRAAGYFTNIGCSTFGTFTGNVTAANFIGNVDYSHVTNSPTIPSDLFDLGITDGSNGQALTTDGVGGVSFNDIVGGSNSQVQYNNSGSLSGLSTLTTDGANVTIGNVSFISSDNRFDRTDLDWNSGSSGSLPTIYFGNDKNTTWHDPFSLTRNSKILVQNKVVRDGSTPYSSVRRTSLSSAILLENTQGNITPVNNDRIYAINAVAAYDGGSSTLYSYLNGNGNSFTPGSFVSQITNGEVTWAQGVSSSTFALNNGTIQKGNVSKGSYGILGTGSIQKAVNFLAAYDNLGTVTTGTVGDSYGLYMGAPLGTSDTIIGYPGSANPSYQTGIAHFLYNNNNNSISRIGSLSQYDEVYDSITHSNSGALEISITNYGTQEVNLEADITELTFAGYNTSTTPKSRLSNSTLIFKQDSAGGRTVTWPTGTKFAGGVTDINSDSDSVTFVSVLIYGGVYYVTIATYSEAV